MVTGILCLWPWSQELDTTHQDLLPPGDGARRAPIRNIFRVVRGEFENTSLLQRAVSETEARKKDDVIGPINPGPTATPIRAGAHGIPVLELMDRKADDADQDEDLHHHSMSGPSDVASCRVNKTPWIATEYL